jgi:hypothetical protein
MILSKKGLLAQRIVLRFALFGLVVFVQPSSLGRRKMAIIADIASIGTAVVAVLFSLWMLKQLFTGK